MSNFFIGFALLLGGWRLFVELYATLTTKQTGPTRLDTYRAVYNQKLEEIQNE